MSLNYSSQCQLTLAVLSLKFVLFLCCFLCVITKTYLYNLYTYIDPDKPHFYKVKLELTGVYIIFLISAQKHRLWVLVRAASIDKSKRGGSENIKGDRVKNSW